MLTCCNILKYSEQEFYIYFVLSLKYFPLMIIFTALIVCPEYNFVISSQNDFKLDMHVCCNIMEYSAQEIYFFHLHDFCYTTVFLYLPFVNHNDYYPPQQAAVGQACVLTICHYSSSVVKVQDHVVKR